MSGKTYAYAKESFEKTEFSCVPIGGIFKANCSLFDNLIIESEVWVKTAKKSAFCFDTNQGKQFKPYHSVKTYHKATINRTYED